MGSGGWKMHSGLLSCSCWICVEMVVIISEENLHKVSECCWKIPKTCSTHNAMPMSGCVII